MLRALKTSTNVQIDCLHLVKSSICCILLHDLDHKLLCHSMEASFYSLTTVIVHNLRMEHPSKLFLEKILFLHAFVQ